MKLGQLRCMRDEISEIVGKQKTAAKKTVKQSLVRQITELMSTPRNIKGHSLMDRRIRDLSHKTKEDPTQAFMQAVKGLSKRQKGTLRNLDKQRNPKARRRKYSFKKKAWATLAKTAFATQPISTKPLDVSLQPTPMKPQGNAVVSAKTPSKNAGAPKGPQAKRVSGVKLTPLTKMGERWGRGLASSLLQKKPGRHFNED